LKAVRHSKIIFWEKVSTINDFNYPETKIKNDVAFLGWIAHCDNAVVVTVSIAGSVIVAIKYLYFRQHGP